MKISIITASYNYAQYIEEAINSVINQTYQNWELIVVDDGSSDNSVEIIEKYCQKDGRIKFFQHENGQNKGLKETILLGLSHATGEWVAFLESDDIFLPENLQKKVNIIQDAKRHRGKDAKLIFNKVAFLYDKDFSKTEKCRNFEKKQKKLAQKTYPRNMFFDFYINNQITTFSCVMVEANVIKSANFDTPSDSMLDWWLWIDIAYENLFYYINEELTYWRLHSESYINTSKKPVLYYIQIQAYYDIYKNNGKSFKLLLFMIFSNIRLYFVRFLRFLKKLSGS